MSSHHIVREKQEPALLVAGLDNLDDEQLGQLLEWSPTVIVSADTAEQVQALGIKIDWLIAQEMMDLQQADIKLIEADVNNAIPAALDQLVKQNYHAVNVIADQFILIDYSDFFERINLVIYVPGKKIIAVRSGFSKWKMAGECIEILTITHNFVYTGLTPVNGNQYRTIDDGFFSLQFTNPYIVIAEHL